MHCLSQWMGSEKSRGWRSFSHESFTDELAPESLGWKCPVGPVLHSHTIDQRSKLSVSETVKVPTEATRFRSRYKQPAGGPRLTCGGAKYISADSCGSVHLGRLLAGLVINVEPCTPPCLRRTFIVDTRSFVARFELIISP